MKALCFSLPFAVPLHFYKNGKPGFIQVSSTFVTLTKQSFRINSNFLFHWKSQEIKRPVVICFKITFQVNQTLKTLNLGRNPFNTAPKTALKENSDSREQSCLGEV